MPDDEKDEEKVDEKDEEKGKKKGEKKEGKTKRSRPKRTDIEPDEEEQVFRIR